MKRILFPILLLLLLLLAHPAARAQVSAQDSVKRKQHSGMSLKAYQSLLKSDKMVLVDFYADWCGPCKRIEPFLEEIEREMKGKLKIIRIDADENTRICNELSVYALPTLFLYKDGKMYWFHTGYVSKEEIMMQVR